MTPKEKATYLIERFTKERKTTKSGIKLSLICVDILLKETGDKYWKGVAKELIIL